MTFCAFFYLFRGGPRGQENSLKQPHDIYKAYIKSTTNSGQQLPRSLASATLFFASKFIFLIKGFRLAVLNTQNHKKIIGSSIFGK